MLIKLKIELHLKLKQDIELLAPETRSCLKAIKIK